MIVLASCLCMAGKTVQGQGETDFTCLCLQWKATGFLKTAYLRMCCRFFLTANPKSPDAKSEVAMTSFSSFNKLILLVLIMTPSTMSIDWRKKLFELSALLVSNLIVCVGQKSFWRCDTYVMPLELFLDLGSRIQIFALTHDLSVSLENCVCILACKERTTIHITQ